MNTDKLINNASLIAAALISKEDGIDYSLVKHHIALAEKALSIALDIEQASFSVPILRNKEGAEIGSGL